jgi:L-fuconolactonase
MIPMIDTHQHLWDLERLQVSWVAAEPTLNRSFTPADYQAATANCGVEQTVYMEVAAEPASRAQEIADVTRFCEEESTRVGGMVIAADPSAPDFEEWLDVHHANRWVKGARQILHTPEFAPRYCLQPQFVQGVRALGARGWLFDLCMRPAELADAVALAQQCPDTQFILDHCGNAVPAIVAGIVGAESEPEGSTYRHEANAWREQVAALAALPNVHCKISGIFARVPPTWNTDLLAPTIDHCLDRFGPDRVLCGSDWPVCLLGGALAEWIQALREIIRPRSAAFQHALLHENARRLYQLSTRSS